MRAGVHDRLQARQPEQLGRRQGLQHRRREHLSCDDAVAAEWHASAARLYRRHLDRRERDLDPAYRPGACLSGPLTTSERELARKTKSGLRLSAFAIERFPRRHCLLLRSAIASHTQELVTTIWAR